MTTPTGRASAVGPAIRLLVLLVVPFACLLLLGGQQGCKRAPRYLPEYPSEPLEPASVPPSYTKSARVYFDVSRNMSGFLAPTQGGPGGSMDGFVYAHVVSELPVTAYGILNAGGDVSLYQFGTDVIEFPVERLDDVLLTRDTYSRCSPGRPCINTLSSLGTVLQRVDGALDAVDVFVTDLFLPDVSVSTATTEAVQPLVRAFKAGRDIGIVGVRARFAGRVKEPDSERSYTAELSDVSWRPFFIVVVGPPSPVQDFVERLESRVLQPVTAGEFHSVILAHAAQVCEASPEELYRSLVLSGGAKQAAGLGRAPASVMQLRLQRKDTEVRLAIDLSQSHLARQRTLSPTSVEGEEKLWLYLPGGGCAPEDHWYEEPASLASELRVADRQITGALLADAGTRLRRDSLYFYHIGLRTSGISETDKQADWIQKWTLNPNAAGNEELLGTKNLHRWFQVLVRALNEEGGVPPQTVAHLYLLFQTGR